MYKNSGLKYRYPLQGGNVAKEGYEKVRSSKLLSTIAVILIILLVIYLIYKIWQYFYKHQEEEETECVPKRGCILFSGVKNGTDVVKIKANRMPHSIHGNDYSLCVWLYVRSSNFSPGERPWKTVMYRGGNLGDNPKPKGWIQTDEQYTVQPGVWLGGQSNRLLIRWETLGRVSNVKSCCKPGDCSSAKDLGTRCMMEDDTIRFCGRDKNGKIGWMTEPSNAYSMNPYVNPPNKLCSATKTKSGLSWNTTDSNTDNETCIDNIPLDRWFHLAMVTHNQSADVYVDGKLVKTVTFNSPPVVHDEANLVLCKDSTNSYATMGRNGYLGAMTQIRYFKMALTPYDVLRIYSWGPHPFEISDPAKLKKELEGIGGSVHVSASVSANYDDQGAEGY